MNVKTTSSSLFLLSPQVSHSTPTHNFEGSTTTCDNSKRKTKLIYVETSFNLIHDIITSLLRQYVMTYCKNSIVGTST